MGHKIKFYTDEHIGKTVVLGLRQRGVDIMMVAEAGMLGASDQDQMAFARKEGRVIFTQDDDFLRLHAGGVDHAGIVYTPQKRSIREIIYGLMLIYQILDAEDMEGHLEYL